MMHYGPGINSASNRNKYQKHFLGGKGNQCTGLTTIPRSCADFLKSGISTSTSWNHQDL